MRNLIAIGVKANARYTCRECGSTELIQAHHKIPGDDNSLVALCAECHSKKHPDVPKALFFSANHQPYWHNKSASSLAKELGVHPRTIIRAAKRLKILPGELSSKDKNLIRDMMTTEEIEECTKLEVNSLGVPILRCLRCSWHWIPRAERLPKVCPNPKCKSPYWNKPRKKGASHD